MLDSELTWESLRKKDSKLYADLKFFNDHSDERCHFWMVRKCLAVLGEKVCPDCKKNPPRADPKVWKDLPPRSSGALFFAPVEDPDHKGHYKTFLDLVKDWKDLPPRSSGALFFAPVED